MNAASMFSDVYDQNKKGVGEKQEILASFYLMLQIALLYLNHECLPDYRPGKTLVITPKMFGSTIHSQITRKTFSTS